MTIRVSICTSVLDQSELLRRAIDSVRAQTFTDWEHIIVDDGSHVPWHQLLTFEIMFETWLKPGGLYIIEDVETSYLDGTNPRIYGYDIIDAGLGKKGSVVEKFKVGVVPFLEYLSSSFLFRAVDH